jgi:hypothetical protein
MVLDTGVVADAVPRARGVAKQIPRQGCSTAGLEREQRPFTDILRMRSPAPSRGLPRPYRP